jgi:hypothetical protein
VLVITGIETIKPCGGCAGRPHEATHPPSPAPLVRVRQHDPRVARLRATEVQR